MSRTSSPSRPTDKTPITEPRLSYDCTGDDRPDPRHAHQPLAAGISARDDFDLDRQILDALIEPVPVTGQVFDDAHHTWRPDIRRCGQCAATRRARGAALAARQCRAQIGRRWLMMLVR